MRSALSRWSSTILRSNSRRALPIALVAVVALTGAAVASTATTTSERSPAPSADVTGAVAVAPAEHDATPGALAQATEVPAVPEVPEVVAEPVPADPSAEALAADEPAPAQDPDRIPLAPVPAGSEAFAGLSTWIDLYDVEWTPQQQVDAAHAAGVDAIYVQSARYNSEDDIHDPQALAALIEAAHDRGIKVMTWYIPDFLDVEKDLRRSQAAIAFTTPRGDRADAFGLDIELDSLPDIGLRNERLLQISAALRSWTGPDYPLAAVVLPPLQLDLNGTWWPGFPYAELRPFYDVYIPMSYSSYRGTDAEKTYQWNLDNVLETRRRAGDPDLPVHLAGGIADNLPEVAAFVEAARDGNVTGAGLYDLHTTRASAWPALQALRLTPGTAGPVPSLLPD